VHTCSVDNNAADVKKFRINSIAEKLYIREQQANEQMLSCISACYVGDSSESESSADSSTDTSVETVDDHDHIINSPSSGGDTGHNRGNHNVDTDFTGSPISSFDNSHSVPDHDSYAELVLSETQSDCNEATSDSCDTDSPAADSDSTESEDYNFSSADDAFMTGSFYEGSNITAGKAVLSVMQFCIDNHLTYKATDELLKLLQVLCITPNKLPKSVYHLKKLYRDLIESEYSHSKACFQCSKDSVDCSCDNPSYGDLITIPIQKPLEVIVSSKF